MAKVAKETQGAGKKKKKGMQGKRKCPKCDRIMGVRVTTCDCGHVFIPKAKKKSGGELSLGKITDLIEQAGGLSALKKALSEYNRVVAPIEALGGYDAAQAILSKVEEIRALK